jgi:23S rRNA (guanosine2251-2'-O)-methyltransferase
MVQLTLILENLRSAHNVGAILRTCDAVGVTRVFACGTTPYPRVQNDDRDPVVINRNTREIAKTALGAETSVSVEHFDDTASAMAAAKAQNCAIYALEQAPSSQNIFEFAPVSPAALIVGNEPNGVDANTLAACDAIIEIPQRGSKESLNVAVATGIAMYQLVR